MAHESQVHQGHQDHHDHGLSHVASMKTLLGTWGTLMVLTVVTVLATKVSLGAKGNLMLAMFIATVKASLVCIFFMHLKYDKLMHTVALLAAVLFGLLFVAFTLMDSNQYQNSVVWKSDNLTPAVIEPAAASKAEAGPVNKTEAKPGNEKAPDTGNHESPPANEQHGTETGPAVPAAPPK